MSRSTLLPQHLGDSPTAAPNALGRMRLMACDWNELIKAEAECKARGTCPRLAIRELYFEPNPGTRSHWFERYGFYGAGIDRRVMFVAESPSDRRHRADAADFEVNGLKGWRCWDYTAQDERFRAARQRYGFEHCLITNAVKCGLPRPSTPANLTGSEAGQATAAEGPTRPQGEA